MGKYIATGFSDAVQMNANELQVAHTIRTQIRNGTDLKGNSGAHLMMCWGFHGARYYSDRLVFNVKGRLVTGYVSVSYDDLNDYYTIDAYSSKHEMVNTVTQVYFDELTNCIDYMVESGPEKEKAIA